MKILRALPYLTGASSAHEVPQILKYIYEFWGYCINGTASLTTPGGLAATTPSNLPAGFLEGSSVLATGADGVTVAGSNQFTSATGTFSLATHLLKYLVIWKAGSNSGDDSIYQIVGVPNATTLVVTPATGGTPQAGTLVPALTSRTSINYRIVDPVAAAALGGLATGQYIVFQTTASNVNAGQANSQFQLTLLTGSGNLNQLAINFSPGGTWTGSAFTDGSSQILSPSGNNWIFATGTNAAGYLTLIGDLDFLICHARSSNHGNGQPAGSFFHIETPIRLYTLAQDPNPFTAAIGVGNVGLVVQSAVDGYGGGFSMIGHDNVTRLVKNLTRSMSGDGPFPVGAENGTIGAPVDLRISYNGQLGKIIISESLLSMMGVAGQFAIARCKAKNYRFVSANVPQWQRVGNNGEFIHILAGICWPWDNSILPYPVLPLGA